METWLDVESSEEQQVLQRPIKQEASEQEELSSMECDALVTSEGIQHRLSHGDKRRTRHPWSASNIIDILDQYINEYPNYLRSRTGKRMKEFHIYIGQLVGVKGTSASDLLVNLGREYRKMRQQREDGLLVGPMELRGSVEVHAKYEEYCDVYKIQRDGRAGEITETELLAALANSPVEVNLSQQPLGNTMESRESSLETSPHRIQTMHVHRRQRFTWSTTKIKKLLNAYIKDFPLYVKAKQNMRVRSFHGYIGRKVGISSRIAVNLLTNLTREYRHLMEVKQSGKSKGPLELRGSTDLFAKFEEYCAVYKPQDTDGEDGEITVTQNTTPTIGKHQLSGHKTQHEHPIGSTEIDDSQEIQRVLHVRRGQVIPERRGNHIVLRRRSFWPIPNILKLLDGYINQYPMYQKMRKEQSVMDFHSIIGKTVGVAGSVAANLIINLTREYHQTKQKAGKSGRTKMRGSTELFHKFEAYCSVYKLKGIGVKKRGRSGSGYEYVTQEGMSTNNGHPEPEQPSESPEPGREEFLEDKEPSQRQEQGEQAMPNNSNPWPVPRIVQLLDGYIREHTMYLKATKEQRVTDFHCFVGRIMGVTGTAAASLLVKLGLEYRKLKMLELNGLRSGDMKLRGSEDLFYKFEEYCYVYKLHGVTERRDLRKAARSGSRVETPVERNLGNLQDALEALSGKKQQQTPSSPAPTSSLSTSHQNPVPPQQSIFNQDRLAPSNVMSDGQSAEYIKVLQEQNQILTNIAKELCLLRKGILGDDDA